MREVPLTKVKDKLSEYLRLAEEENIIITRHGKPAGILVGFATEIVLTLHQPDAAIAAVIGGTTRFEVVC